jgi:hypothetical protein
MALPEMIIPIALVGLSQIHFLFNAYRIWKGLSDRREPDQPLTPRDG